MGTAVFAVALPLVVTHAVLVVKDISALSGGTQGVGPRAALGVLSHAFSTSTRPVASPSVSPKIRSVWYIVYVVQQSTQYVFGSHPVPRDAFPSKNGTSASLPTQTTTNYYPRVTYDLNKEKDPGKPR